MVYLLELLKKNISVNKNFVLLSNKCKLYIAINLKRKTNETGQNRRK